MYTIGKALLKEVMEWLRINDDTRVIVLTLKQAKMIRKVLKSYEKTLDEHGKDCNDNVI